MRKMHIAVWNIQLLSWHNLILGGSFFRFGVIHVVIIKLRAAVDLNVYTNLPILIDSNVDLYMYLIETLGSVHVKIDV